MFLVLHLLKGLAYAEDRGKSRSLGLKEKQPLPAEPIATSFTLLKTKSKAIIVLTHQCIFMRLTRHSSKTISAR